MPSFITLLIRPQLYNVQTKSATDLKLVSRMIVADSYHIVLLGFTLFIAFAAYRLRQPSRLPDDIPWVGGFTTSFGKLFAPFRAFFRGSDFMDEAYYKFGKLDRICVMPNIFENRIFLPSSYMDWIVRQPPQKLNGIETLGENIEATYTLRYDFSERKPAFEMVVHRQLNLHLDEMTSDMMDEIGFSIDQLLGLDTNQYKTVNLHRAMIRIIVGTSSRVFVGQPLCRDQDFIENTIRYAYSVPYVGFLLRLLPSRLVPIFGKSFSLVNRFFYLKTARSLSPRFLERMTSWHANSDDDLPNNGLSWFVDEIMKHETYKTVDKKLGWLTRKTMNLLFAASLTTTLSVSNFILDVFSAPAGQHCVNDLLTESEALNEKFGSRWDRDRLIEMMTMDSALKESLRVSSVCTTVNTRRVMAPDGLVLPNDTRLPCGSLVEMAAYSVHHDESIYPGPLEYRHTRFMQSSKEGTALKNATTVEPAFLVWGYGRHICPGRSLAVDIMKLIMTYLITNYEVMPLSERPKNTWMAEYTAPPFDATLEVRRRPGTVKK